MEEMKQIKERIQDVIRPNGVGAITAADHQALLLDIVETIDSNKADKNGRHPAMSVGFADNLTGHGESVPAEFSFRASGGKSIADGVARIKVLRGNSIVANGQLLHSHVEAIKSVGDNAWNEQWEIGGISESNGTDYDASYYMRSSYVRILPNTEYYFKKPQGILTYLYFYDVNKEFVGWLDPFATSGEGGMFTTLNASYLRFSCMQTTYNHDIMLSLVHSGWKVDTNAGYQPYWEDTLEIDPRIRASFPDGMMLYDYAFNRNGKGVIVKATKVVDGEVAKKETYEVYEFDQPFNLDYRVADFGTEEAISSQPSAPFRADIIYQFNAVDMIRQNYAEIQQLKEIIAQMTK